MRAHERKQKSIDAQKRALGKVRAELAELESRSGSLSPAEQKRAAEIRELVRASERALLIACLPGGEQSYRRLGRKYGHEKLWQAFSGATAALSRDRVVARIARGLMMWSRRQRVRLLRLYAWLQEA